MGFEDRVRSSVEAALAEVRSRAEDDTRRLVDQLLAAAADERAEVEQEARRLSGEETAVHWQRVLAETEARLRGHAAQAMTEAVEHERREADRRLTEAAAAADDRMAVARSDAETRVKAALADAETKATQTLAELEAASAFRMRQAEVGLTRLVDSVRALDSAASLSEILDALGQAASREAARAAVLVLRNDRLLGWKLAGFGDRDQQPRAVELALTNGDILALAVTSARPATTADAGSSSQGPPFADLPADRNGVAVPLLVGGRVVAVVYADDAGEDAGRANGEALGWTDVIEILARHGARCLEALTVQKAAAPSSPRFWVPAAAHAPGATNAATAKLGASAVPAITDSSRQTGAA